MHVRASTLVTLSVVCYGAMETLAKGLQNGPQQCWIGLSPLVESWVLPCKVVVENLCQCTAHWLVNIHAQVLLRMSHTTSSQLLRLTSVVTPPVTDFSMLLRFQLPPLTSVLTPPVTDFSMLLRFQLPLTSLAAIYNLVCLLSREEVVWL